MALSEASWFLHMVKVAEVSRAARRRKKKRDVRDIAEKTCALAYRVAVAITIKPIGHDSIYIPSSVLARGVPCRRNERKNREGRWKGTTSIIYRKRPSFSSDETFRSEKHPEKRERVKWKNNRRKLCISNARSPTTSGSKFSIRIAFIVKLYDHAMREKLSR